MKERTTATCTPMPDKPPLLLVDDEVHVAWSIGRILTRAGFSVTTCANTEEAISALQARVYDMLVTDIQMPGEDGLKLIDWVRHYRPAIRIAVITGFESPSIRKAAFKKGVTLFFKKPVDTDLLIEVLRDPDNRNRFWGSIEGVDIFDYIQLLLVTRQHYILEVVSKDGTKGELYVNQGNVEHACCEDLIGEAAFYRILGFEGGRFSTLPWSEPKRKSINVPGNHLILEAARKKDEFGKSSSPSNEQGVPSSHNSTGN